MQFVQNATTFSDDDHASSSTPNNINYFQDNVIELQFRSFLRMSLKSLWTWEFLDAYLIIKPHVWDFALYFQLLAYNLSIEFFRIELKWIVLISLLWLLLFFKLVTLLLYNVYYYFFSFIVVKIVRKSKQVVTIFVKKSSNSLRGYEYY